MRQRARDGGQALFGKMPLPEEKAIDPVVEVSVQEIERYAQTDRSQDVQDRRDALVLQHAAEDVLDQGKERHRSKGQKRVNQRAADDEADIHHTVTDYSVGDGYRNECRREREE